MDLQLKMETPEQNITGIISVIIAGITAFLFGHSGLFTKAIDFFFKTKEKKQTEDDELIRIKNEEIHELRTEVENLRKTINTLDKDLVKMTTYIKILLPYLETLMPEGSNPFIKEMAKEIRENTPR
tara:strand:- start:180 stop:557 length:378 start_codon:yes stop_codon:yes gene_type:complete